MNIEFDEVLVQELSDEVLEQAIGGMGAQSQTRYVMVEWMC